MNTVSKIFGRGSLIKVNAPKRLEVGDIIDTIPSTTLDKLVSQEHSWLKPAEGLTQLVLDNRRTEPNERTRCDGSSLKFFSESFSPRTDSILVSPDIS